MRWWLAEMANYVGLDRIDLQFCAQGACHSMSKLYEKGWVLLKRIERYRVDASDGPRWGVGLQSQV